MRPVRIEGYTRELAKDQPEYGNLCIRDEPVEIEIGGNPTLVNGMTAAFEPTPQQLALLTAGGKIHVRILGSAWPPIALWAEPAPEAA